MMWLMDHVFKYTNFGLVSLIHGDFFIRQVRQTLGDLYLSGWLLLGRHLMADNYLTALVIRYRFMWPSARSARLMPQHPAHTSTVSAS